MKFKLKDTPIDVLSANPLEDYLRQIGIVKPMSFIGVPSIEDEENFENLRDIDLGLEMFHKHMKRGSSVFLQVD